MLDVIPQGGRGAATHERLAEWERQQYPAFRARPQLTAVDDALPHYAPELLAGGAAQRDGLRHALRSL